MIPHELFDRPLSLAVWCALHTVDGGGRAVGGEDGHRDFIGYGRRPPTLAWPGGARLAVNFVVNYEEGAERNALDGDEVHEVLVESRYDVPGGVRDYSTESGYEYGSRVGIWRVLDAFADRGASPTIFAAAVALERNPAVADAVRELGYDVVGHGYRWIAPLGQTREQEAADVRAALESIRATTGHQVLGWYTRPPKTENTRSVLAEAGLLYDCDAFNDDTPYTTEVDGRPFLVVPYSLDVNDIRFWKGQMFRGEDFADYACAAFDVLYAEGARASRMLSIGLHPRIIGRPGRIASLWRVIEHIARHEDVWVTGRDAIARHWLAAVTG